MNFNVERRAHINWPFLLCTGHPSPKDWIIQCLLNISRRAPACLKYSTKPFRGILWNSKQTLQVSLYHVSLKNSVFRTINSAITSSFIYFCALCWRKVNPPSNGYSHSYVTREVWSLHSTRVSDGYSGSSKHCKLSSSLCMKRQCSPQKLVARSDYFLLSYYSQPRNKVATIVTCS